MNDAVTAGREAWARLRDHERASWDMWLCVGRALVQGRIDCMKIAGVNEPKGGKYNYAAEVWLAQNGFSDMWPGERHRIVKIVENLPAVERWLASLPPERKRRINHPSAWLTYLKETNDAARACTRPYRPSNGNKATHTGYHRVVRFDQAAIRRAGDAMRKAWCNDCYRLAAIALAAAIRNETDLLALLPPAATPAARSSRSRTADQPHAA
jgi:hypothetical protein